MSSCECDTDLLDGYEFQLENCYADMDSDMDSAVTYLKKHKGSAWTRNNHFRRRIKKQFLSLNQGMTIEECCPLYSTANAIYICEASNFGGYSINHVNQLYVTKRGYVEQFRGQVKWWKSVYVIENKNRDAGNVTNRRIRH